MTDHAPVRPTRRHLLAGALAAGPLLAAGATTAHAEAPDVPGAAGGPLSLGVLGGNLNESLDELDLRQVRQSRTRWVRGFLPMPSLDSATDVTRHPVVRAALDARARGLHVVLGLKFPYPNTPFPAPGTEGMTRELDRLDRVLPVLLDVVDVLVVGNEPFIESRPAERDIRLNTFYETLATHVIATRQRLFGDACRTHLYMGALNRLDLAVNRTPATERWMRFVRETPEIDGTDLHPHVPDGSRSQQFLDYALPRMRPEQTFLVTEFSIVWWWGQHMTDPVPPDFADRYGLSRDLEAWQVIGRALDDPFPEHRWSDFLEQSPWFAAKDDTITEQVSMFRDTGRLAFAGYAFTQIASMASAWSATKPPWLLNPLFAPLTVQPRGDGSAAPNAGWLAQYRRLQVGT